MTHLTTEELIEFVSFDKITEETIALSSRVNEHIRTCSSCFEKVSAFQTVYDELCRIGNTANIKQTIYKLIDEDELEARQERELSEEFQSSEDFQRKNF